MIIPLSSRWFIYLSMKAISTYCLDKNGNKFLPILAAKYVVWFQCHGWSQATWLTRVVIWYQDLSSRCYSFSKKEITRKKQIKLPLHPTQILLMSLECLRDWKLRGAKFSILRKCIILGGGDILTWSPSFQFRCFPVILNWMNSCEEDFHLFQ